MNIKEFSQEFDILYNNIASDIAPGLNNYEKSVFLTQAQESVIRELYNGTFSTEGFEQSAETTSYLNSLVVSKLLNEINTQNNSTFYTVPKDCMYIILEDAKLNKGACGNINCKVVPITHDEYHSILNNPFRGPSSSRILRLMYSDKIELISTLPVVEYMIKYIKRPKPIILEDLPAGLTISELSTATECEASEDIHRFILSRAVLLAKSAWNNAN